MTVRCQSIGHLNTVRDNIFIDHSACVEKYNSSLTNDNCYKNHGGASGTVFVKETWDLNGGDDCFFFESTTRTETTYKGYFNQGGHGHLFYETTEQPGEF